ncbi:Retrovirus-related Pol polyprotein from transposon TNT 1-94 [Sesamum angolense]|uniref:Retrovirus-related Pol polyprotein from transposon TNT 1-94 n=1 Tax=Sesamum angolense TaxID=2727404 RepID=A0AAE2BWU5_9LAMI|nr:Retrovirus-related Pol polyprotein from transposon TNT 1-94 [Sesamum angolense]
MDSIISNGTWVLVDLLPGCTTIGCELIFKKKLKLDGSIYKFKTRLVAKGFKQKEGIDYFDTYSLVALLTTIRVLIALASVYNLPIHQMDVKTTFLYGELEEEIYMDQPEGFVTRSNKRKVCKLVKSLYGLKQAPKQWHEKFDKTILAFGFTGALDRVLRYLKGTVSLAIHYDRFPAVLGGYSDASWIVKNSGTELCALNTTSTEAEWLFVLLSQLPIIGDEIENPSVMLLRWQPNLLSRDPTEKVQCGSEHMAYSVNPKDQHKVGGLLLLTDAVTLTGSNSRLSSI